MANAPDAPTRKRQLEVYKERQKKNNKIVVVIVMPKFACFRLKKTLLGISFIIWDWSVGFNQKIYTSHTDQVRIRKSRSLIDNWIFLVSLCI